MSKEKNKNTFRIGALLLVACLISSVMLSGTFAKYTSEYAGEDTALVARWSFDGHFDDTLLSEASFDLPIWNHAYTENIYEQEGIDYLIAPGIQGEFTVDFTYDADVDADLIFNLSKSGNAATTTPIQYALDKDFTTVYYDLNDLEDAIIDIAINTTISGAGGTYIITDTVGGSEVTIDETVYWRWPYDVTVHDNDALLAAGFVPNNTTTWENEDDTEIGNASQAINRDSYVLVLEIKATQRIPASFAMATAIGGTPEVGQTLSAGALNPALSATYQWQVSDATGMNFTNIDLAKSDEYVVGAGDEGKFIRVIATGIGAYDGTVISAPVGPIEAAED
jgi:hypothetical protein